MGAASRSARSSNLLASGLVCAAAAVACNQLFSIEEPTHAEGGSGGSTTQGLSGNGGSAADATGASGGTGGLDSTSTAENPMATTTDDGGGGSSSGGSTTASSGGTGGTTSSGGTGGTTTDGSGGMTTTDGSGGTTTTDGSGGTTTTNGSGGTTSMGSTTSSGGAATSATTASVTTGIVIPPDPCEGEDLHGPALVEIAAGTGVIGNDIMEDNAWPVINPDFDVFCIDETEVTVDDYQECVDDDACEPPLDGVGQCPVDPPPPGNHPMGCVDWERADAYCQWAGKRLPSEQEWEYAARGPEGRAYPWGNNAVTDDRLNWNSVVGVTTPVKSYPNGATPEGVYDMAGNVWEWTASTWCSDYSSAPDECDPAIHVPRGGSYVSVLRYVSPSYRDADNVPDERFGFRCAFGPEN